MDYWTDLPRIPAMVDVAAHYVRVLLEGQPIVDQAEGAVRHLAEIAVQRGTGSEMTLHVEAKIADGWARVGVLYSDHGDEHARPRELRWSPR